MAYFCSVRKAPALFYNNAIVPVIIYTRRGVSDRRTRLLVSVFVVEGFGVRMRWRGEVTAELFSQQNGRVHSEGMTRI